MMLLVINALSYGLIFTVNSTHNVLRSVAHENLGMWFVSVSVATINPPALVSAKGRVFQETLTRLALPPRKRWACYARKRMVGLKTLQVTGLLPSVGVRTYVVIMPR